MTLRSAYRYLQEQLLPANGESEAAIISEWVLEHITGVRKTERALQKEKTLSAEQELQMSEALTRLLTHEPVQYVLNEAWFCGLKLYVDRHVLIPRPETEELVEWVISECKFPIDQISILDIGTGSGCIALALKKRLGKVQVTACDVSEEALAVAKRNGKSLGIDVNFVMLDFLNADQWASLPKVDIIISNPPYIASKESETMHANVLKYEPSLALFVPDENALLFYKTIAEFSKEHLHPGGQLYVEINEALGLDTLSLFKAQGYDAVLKKDMQGKDRMIRATIS